MHFNSMILKQYLRTIYMTYYKSDVQSITVKVDPHQATIQMFKQLHFWTMEQNTGYHQMHWEPTAALTTSLEVEQKPNIQLPLKIEKQAYQLATIL